MSEELLQQLIELLKTTSPFIWQTLIKQVYVEIFGFIVWGVVCGIGAYLLKNVKISFDSENDNEIFNTVRIVIVIILTIVSIGFLLSSIQWAINPEFYALKFLLGKITGN